MISSRKLTSIFSNPVGAAVWAVLAAIFSYNHLGKSAGICLIFCLLFFSSWLWTKYALSRLEIQVTSGTQCAFPGEELSLTCRSANRKLLPLIWLELSFPLGEKSCVLAKFEENSKKIIMEETGAEADCACALISWLLWNQEAVMEIPVKAVHRGICSFTHVYASSGDLLGLGSKDKSFTFSDSSALVVYPAVFPVLTDDLLRTSSDLEAGRNGYMEDVTLLKMSRPYQPGDSAKKINWRQLAGQNKMSVNIYETVFPKLATFLLDLPSFRKGTVEKNAINASDILVWQPLEKELEDMLSLTASCIISLNNKGISCGLIIPGTTQAESTFQLPGKKGSGPQELLYSLAAINYKVQDVEIPQLEIADCFSMLGTLYIVTCSYETMTVSRDAFAGLGSIALLSKEASSSDDTCPFQLFLMDHLTEGGNPA